MTGIDLTPEYVELASFLSQKTGLADRTEFKTASALHMPFADGAFDGAVTFHVAMNIKDRAGLYREIARVLKPGATLCIYDVMKGPDEGVRYPVPWAESAENSHLTSAGEMQDLLHAAGFRVTETEGAIEIRDRFLPRPACVDRTAAGTRAASADRRKHQGKIRQLPAQRRARLGRADSDDRASRLGFFGLYSSAASEASTAASRNASVSVCRP